MINNHIIHSFYVKNTVIDFDKKIFAQNIEKILQSIDTNPFSHTLHINLRDNFMIYLADYFLEKDYQLHLYLLEKEQSIDLNSALANMRLKKIKEREGDTVKIEFFTRKLRKTVKIILREDYIEESIRVVYDKLSDKIDSVFFYDRYFDKYKNKTMQKFKKNIIESYLKIFEHDKVALYFHDSEKLKMALLDFSEGGLDG